MKTDLRLAAPYSPAALAALADQFGSPLFVIDCDRLRAQYRALERALPGVELHYALKPLPDRTVVQVLAREGASFDLATNGEVDLVRDAGIPRSGASTAIRSSAAPTSATRSTAASPPSSSTTQRKSRSSSPSARR